MNKGVFIGSSQSTGDEVPVEEKVPHNARDSQTEPKRGRVSSMVWELYTNEKDAHTWGSLEFANTVVTRLCIERNRNEQFRIAEMQPFLKAMMLLDPTKSTGLVQQCQGKHEKDNWSSFKRRNITKFQPNRLHSSVHPAKTDEKGNLAKIEKALAMHYYLTEIAFSRIKEERTCSVTLESVNLI
ncbi:hypothetical protein BASA60_011510 [Batrachochytrium salamandrivorans]|nr:hypothetical protein BASA60_011510 [Batrachochytrium salamandrivorans]